MLLFCNKLGDNKMIVYLIIGGLLILVMLFLFCALKVSSECGRLEEQYEKEI